MIETPMPKVRLLDDSTINRIAAGEVIDRPASVIKELIENALDAGAARIEIEIDGRSVLRVKDDGCGMTPEDAHTALQRHATSKIQTADDLQTIRTMGFRGEALPSIASVSRLTLTTRSAESEAGIKIVVEGGRIELSEPVGAPVGTVVEALDLFFNVPARLKFLKSPATETARIVETVAKYAIGRPDVSFRLLNGGQEILFTPGQSDLITVVAAVWGIETAKSLVELDETRNGIRVTGLVSPPHATRATRQNQLFYVNGRPARNRAMLAALDESYRAITPERRYPSVVLMLEADPSRVDANVHPAKSEVKFDKESDVFDAIYHAVRNGLLNHGMIPEAVVHRPRSFAFAHQGASIGKEELDALFGRPAGIQPGSPLPPDPSDPFADPQLAPAHLPFGDLLDELRILGQVQETFIVASTASGIVIIDQHVAHERVLYELFSGYQGSAPVPRQYLLAPQSLQLDRRAAVMMEETLPELARLGFELEPFGDGAYLVRSVPTALANKDYLKSLKEIVEELTEMSGGKKIAVAQDQVWIMSACKMAVKAGDPLNLPEMTKLIQDLAKTENPYLCPHGRPITLKIGWDELERRFKR